MKDDFYSSASSTPNNLLNERNILLNFYRGGNSNGGANGWSDGADEWNAREEMRLLDAVEQFGYGNWKDISGFIETKTPEQASLLLGLHIWSHINYHNH